MAAEISLVLPAPAGCNVSSHSELYEGAPLGSLRIP